LAHPKLDERQVLMAALEQAPRTAPRQRATTLPPQLPPVLPPPRKLMVKLQVVTVGPVGLEPTTRGLKVRCSAS
jgi:hypothetical protein